MWCNLCKQEVEIIDGGFCAKCYTALAGVREPDYEPTAVDPYVPGPQNEKATALEATAHERRTVIEPAPRMTKRDGLEFGKTVFVDPSSRNPARDPETPDPRLLEGPKLIGWLASFSHDPRGLDYQLRQGRNAIGSSAESEIQIDYDTRVSSQHAVITWREGKLTITDVHSQNGTKLNDVFLDGGTATILANKDKVLIGRTEFTVYLVE